MRSLRTLALAAVMTAALLTGAAACSSTTGPEIDTAGATVIDVRTPGEYTAGHLEGAVNIDIQNENGFLSGIRQLDRDGKFVVYCRSGNRSAAAANRMRDLGFTDVVDAGGFDEAAAATGLRVVT